MILRLIMTSVLLLSACESSAAPSVNWLRFKPVGEMDKPLPITWVSDSQDPRSQFADLTVETLVVLPIQQYQALAAGVRSMRCPRALRGEALRFGTLEVAEFANGSQRVLCFVRSDQTCNYLLNVLELRVGDRLNELADPIGNLGLRVGCKDERFGRPRP
jgi:hypothetical protein